MRVTTDLPADRYPEPPKAGDRLPLEFAGFAVPMTVVHAEMVGDVLRLVLEMPGAKMGKWGTGVTRSGADADPRMLAHLREATLRSTSATLRHLLRP